MTGMIWVLGILGFVALYFIISYPIVSIKERFNQIKNNTKLLHEIREDLNNVKDKLNMSERLASLEAKMSLFNKSKKGQIDPRWVIIIIILILLFFYLRYKKYLNLFNCFF